MMPGRVHAGVDIDARGDGLAHREHVPRARARNANAGRRRRAAGLFDDRQQARPEQLALVARLAAALAVERCRIEEGFAFFARPEASRGLPSFTIAKTLAPSTLNFS